MVNILFILLISLIFPGIINKTKAYFGGRKGASILQPTYELFKLIHKGVVYSSSSSIITQITPVIYLAVSLLVICFLYVAYPPLISFTGDFLFVIYLLTLAKFFMIISALDRGSAFEGMGASREALYSMLAEPIIFTLFSVFIFIQGHIISIASIVDVFKDYGFVTLFILISICIMLFLFTLIENSRIPVDDPNTHLELTMVHEVMILDYSGIDLAMMVYGTVLKFVIYGTLIFNLILSYAKHFIILSDIQTIGLFLIIQIVFAVFIGIVESVFARLHMNHNSQFILSVLSIAIIIFITSFITHLHI